jgi:class 3 adenylate cyclase
MEPRDVGGRILKERDRRCRRQAMLAAEMQKSADSIARRVLDLERRVGTVIVSECGDAKRQLAYFGDTMNVAARLCEYCKVVNHRLVISGDLLHQMTIPGDLRVDGGVSVALRGRQERIEAHAIELPAVITGLEERLPRGGPYLSPST